MSGYDERFYTSTDGLKLFYRDYANGGSRLPVLCIPGLTRNSRDFDAVADHLARTRRVLTADLRGRGRSDYGDWRTYSVVLEAADMSALLLQAQAPRVVVLGTSRGGLVGMLMATFPGMVAGLILNDVGAELAPEGLERILDLVGTDMPQPDWDAAAAAMETRYGAMFPGVGRERWLVFARALYREEEGRVVPDYDLKLGEAMRLGRSSQKAGADLWPLFRAVEGAPMLVLRGERSDLLSAETLQKMQEAKPDLQTAVVKDRGHAPFLDEPEAIAAIDAFLERIQ